MVVISTATVFTGCRNLTENVKGASMTEDVEGNYAFVQSLIKKYGDRGVYPNYYDTDVSTWNSEWQIRVFNLDEVTNGQVNCYDLMISYLRENGTEGFSICWGYYSEVKYWNRHVFLKRNGVIIDPNPDLTGEHIITAEFKF